MEAKALGKGLSALIPENKDKINGEMIARLKTESILDNTFQPRMVYDEEKLNSLKASIKEKGVLQPILVRKRGGQFEVIAGERRLRAARALNLKEIPAIIKNVTDQEAFIIALIENIQREELNPIEEAEAYQRMIEEFEYTQESVAQSVGKDRSTISNMLRILKLPTDIRNSIADGRISMGHARALLSLEVSSERDKLFALIMNKGLSVREVEGLVQSKSKGGTRRVKRTENKGRDVIALEEDLQRALGTKVRLVTQKKRGKIVIEYYSYDDLDRIIQLIKK